MDISSVAAQQVALTQARVQTQVAVRLAKLTREVGAPQQILELVRNAAAAAAETMDTAAAPPGGLDVCA